jgi:hypothetical protein
MERKRTIIFSATILIIVGSLILLENFQIIRGISIHWPIFLLITGGGFVLLFFQRDHVDQVLLWLGSFIFILGVFFYYLNFTSWDRLSSLWPFFLGIIGFSFLSVGMFTRKKIFAYFAIFFIALFIVFTLVYSVSIKLWPISFVVFGICLLILD